MTKLKSAKDIPIGGIIPEPGNSRAYRTGEWRSQRPVWIPEGCVHCLMCWVYCPDNAIEVEDGKVKGIDYNHCKGCGICVRECPRKEKALRLEREA
ncbi:MAG TPA: 4Fe-4S binding protein [Firmicutes bacterium]|nr:4Fe-4S binding protein [Candidatus Fermentithermobacillaceae bacterium]